MMGALDGQPPVAMQPDIPTTHVRGDNQDQTLQQKRTMKSKASVREVMSELKNLQITEQKEQKRRKSKSPRGKENADSPLRMSELRSGQNIEVYRVTQDMPDAGVNFYSNFLRIPAERDSESVRFPPIPQEAWGQRPTAMPRQDFSDMPLLHVDRTVPGHKFPVNQRPHSLSRYQPDPGYFMPPPSVSSAPLGPSAQCPPRQLESPDSGIGIPLLRLPSAEKMSKRQPRFGELLPPNMMSEVDRERRQQEELQERYLREYHELQVLSFQHDLLLTLLLKFVLL